MPKSLRRRLRFLTLRRFSSRSHCFLRRCSLSCCSAARVGMSYYINGPRIFTPSTFKQSKQFLPMESFGSTVEQAAEAPPNPLNVCHRSRFSNLQHTHPSAFLPRTRTSSAGPSFSPPNLFALTFPLSMPSSQGPMRCSAKRRPTRQRRWLRRRAVEAIDALRCGCTILRRLDANGGAMSSVLFCQADAPSAYRRHRPRGPRCEDTHIRLVS